MGFYRWARVTPELVTPDYSIAASGTIRGEKIEVGCYRYPPEPLAEPHQHRGEQVINVLAGKLRARTGREERILGPGDAVHIFPNTEHEVWTADGGPRS